MPVTATPELDEIYRALKTGGGRERVTDKNVEPLIALARERGDTTLEYLLREWRSPCGDDAHMPDISPTLSRAPGGAEG